MVEYYAKIKTKKLLNILISFLQNKLNGGKKQNLFAF